MEIHRNSQWDQNETGRTPPFSLKRYPLTLHIHKSNLIVFHIFSGNYTKWYKVLVDLNSSQNYTHDLHILMHIVILCWELLKWLANHRKLRHSSNTKCELPMQVSVGSTVLPKNCHRCTSPEWGHVTANTSVVHAAVQAPKIIFPEELAISKKNKDDLKWEKAFPAFTHLPPPHCSCLLCRTVTRQAERMNELMATKGDNPLRDLLSKICLRSSMIFRQISEAVSLLFFWAPHSLLNTQKEQILQQLGRGTDRDIQIYLYHLSHP